MGAELGAALIGFPLAGGGHHRGNARSFCLSTWGRVSFFPRSPHGAHSDRAGPACLPEEGERCASD